jgi:hypothetical protein
MNEVVTKYAVGLLDAECPGPGSDLCGWTPHLHPPPLLLPSVKENRPLLLQILQGRKTYYYLVRAVGVDHYHSTPERRGRGRGQEKCREGTREG